MMHGSWGAAAAAAAVAALTYTLRRRLVPGAAAAVASRNRAAFLSSSSLSSSSSSLSSLSSVATVHAARACRSSPHGAVPADPVAFRVGVIADVQYADADDAWDFGKRVKRRYRGSLASVRRGVAAWVEEGVTAVVQLGDVIDGRCKQECGSLVALRTVQALLKPLGDAVPVHDVVGNHELYNLSRADMVSAGLFQPWVRHRPMQSGADAAAAAAAVGAASVPQPVTPSTHCVARLYYDFAPHAGWRFIVLDSYDVGVLGGTHESQQAAYAYLAARNPNDVRAPADWTHGLAGLDLRFLPYNGGVGPGQLAWLRATLRKARVAAESVAVFSHVPLCPLAAPRCSTLLWNYADVMHAIHTDGGDAVVAVFAGHAHRGGAAVDSHGVYHRTLEAPLEVEPGDVAFATIDVHTESRTLVLRGRGAVAPVMVMNRQRGAREFADSDGERV